MHLERINLQGCIKSLSGGIEVFTSGTRYPGYLISIGFLGTWNLCKYHNAARQWILFTQSGGMGVTKLCCLHSFPCRLIPFICTDVFGHDFLVACQPESLFETEYFRRAFLVKCAWVNPSAKESKF